MRMAVRTRRFGFICISRQVMFMECRPVVAAIRVKPRWIGKSGGFTKVPYSHPKRILSMGFFRRSADILSAMCSRHSVEVVDRMSMPLSVQHERAPFEPPLGLASLP